MINNDNNKLTKKELNSIFRQTFTLQMGWNYEVMQGLGYAHSMEKMIKRNYKTDIQRAKACEAYMEFFNCNPHTSALIQGANIALEEEFPGSLDEARALKLSLMGPLSGVGDTLIVAIYGTLVFAIAGSVALSGTSFAWIGAFLPILLFSIPMVLLRYKLFMSGYTYGKDLFTEYASEFELIKKYSYMFGLLVIGALAASMVKVNFPNEVLIGEVPIALNDQINSIFPKIGALAVSLICYWSLGKKGMNSTKLLLLVLVGSVILGALGILV